MHASPEKNDDLRFLGDPQRALDGPESRVSSFESNAGKQAHPGSRRHLSGSQNQPSNLGELLDVVKGLLEKHEVRLCLGLLDTLCECRPLAQSSLISEDLDISRALAVFFESFQLRNDDALQGLMKRFPVLPRSERVDGDGIRNNVINVLEPWSDVPSQPPQPPGFPADQRPQTPAGPPGALPGLPGSPAPLDSPRNHLQAQSTSHRSVHKSAHFDLEKSTGDSPASPRATATDSLSSPRGTASKSRTTSRRRTENRKSRIALLLSKELGTALPHRRSIAGQRLSTTGLSAPPPAAMNVGARWGGTNVSHFIADEGDRNNSIITTSRGVRYQEERDVERRNPSRHVKFDAGIGRPSENDVEYETVEQSKEPLKAGLSKQQNRGFLDSFEFSDEDLDWGEDDDDDGDQDFIAAMTSDAHDPDSVVESNPDMKRLRTEIELPNGDPDAVKSSSKWIINPNSMERLTWDILGLIFILAESVCVPLSVGFDVEFHEEWYWLVTVYFMIDLISQFFTGYYKDGQLIMQKNRITRNYLKSWCILDIVATLPWEYIFGEGSSLTKVARFLKMLRLFRLLRILRLKSIVDRLEDALPSASAALLLSLLKITVIFILVCHWVACIWGFLGNPNKTGYHDRDEKPYAIESCEPGGPCENGIVGSPWMYRYGLANYEVGDRYAIAMQFAAGVLSGADTGLTPGSWFERIYISAMMIVSFLFCSVLLSKIVVVVDQMSHKHAALKHRIHCAKEFMNRKKVPLVLQAKVKRYLEYEHDMSIMASRQNTDFIDRLSRWIRLELVEQIHSDYILRHPFFKELSRPSLQRVCGEAHTVLCAPGDIVVHRAHRATGMCFVVTGKLMIIDKRADAGCAVFKTIEQEAWIGDGSLFKDMTWPSTAVSIGHSELLTVSRDAVMKILEEFPKDRKVYKKFQEKAKTQLKSMGTKIMLEQAPKMEGTNSWTFSPSFLSKKSSKEATGNEQITESKDGDDPT